MHMVSLKRALVAAVASVNGEEFLPRGDSEEKRKVNGSEVTWEEEEDSN